MRVVILGASGQLATHLIEASLEGDLIPLSHDDLDICDHWAVNRVLKEIDPNVVINTAAFHQVDDCEKEVDLAFETNSFAVRSLAQVCADLGRVLVHISTDYVFDGDKDEPYTEEDPALPLNVYGTSKLAGEYFIRALCPKHFIVRTSGLYGRHGAGGHGDNFVETMLRLAQDGRSLRVVNDQVLSPTYAEDLATGIRHLLQTEAYGLYHITNHGSCSWYEFAAAIFEKAGVAADLKPTTSEDYGAAAARPRYSVLSGEKFGSLSNWKMRPWQEALVAYLQARSIESHLRRGPVPRSS